MITYYLYIIDKGRSCEEMFGSLAIVRCVLFIDSLGMKMVSLAIDDCIPSCFKLSLPLYINHLRLLRSDKYAQMQS